MWEYKLLRVSFDPKFRLFLADENKILKRQQILCTVHFVHEKFTLIVFSCVEFVIKDH